MKLFVLMLALSPSDSHVEQAMPTDAVFPTYASCMAAASVLNQGQHTLYSFCLSEEEVYGLPI